MEPGEEMGSESGDANDGSGLHTNKLLSSATLYHESGEMFWLKCRTILGK